MSTALGLLPQKAMCPKNVPQSCCFTSHDQTERGPFVPKVGAVVQCRHLFGGVAQHRALNDAIHTSPPEERVERSAKDLTSTTLTVHAYHW